MINDEFRKTIINLENSLDSNLIDEYKGKYPILLTSIHSMKQIKDDGTIKLAEPFTKAIAKYIAKTNDLFYLIKTYDDGIDPNHTDIDRFKIKLAQFIKNNNIQLVLDIHGANIKKEFDVEFGTMNNLSADFSTINELKESFIENGIENISINNPFKGGKITQFLYFNTDVEVIQIEINKKFRDYNNIDNIEKICVSLTNFINKYVNKK